GGPNRVVRAVVAESQPRRLGARCPRDDLVPEADPEERPAIVDDRASETHRAVETGGVAGPRRQDEPVDVSGEGDPARNRMGQDPDASAAFAHPLDDVRLEAEVDDPDQWPVFIVPPDVHDRGG